MPKIYTKKSHAKSAITNCKKADTDYGWRGAPMTTTTRYLDPVPISAEIDEPKCDDCPNRFKCFTQK